MQIDKTQLSAKVYAKNEEKNIFYIKVDIPSLGMYINSITARQSPKHDNLWVQMPAFWAGKWVKPIEFRGSSEFKDLMEDLALRAVEEYNDEHIEYEDVDLSSVPDFGD